MLTNARFYTATILAILLLSGAARAAGTADRGDLLARWGAYQDADAAYRQAFSQTADPNEKLRLLVRRLAVAEVQQNEGAVHMLADQIESALGNQAQPDIRMRVALARGNLANRTGRVAEARRQFDKAQEFATSLQTMGAAMARYVCQTYHYFEQVEQQGRPSPNEYLATFNRVYAPITQIPETTQFEPLDVMRAASWSRFWINKAIDYSVETLEAKDSAASMEWFTVANNMGTNGSSVLLHRAYAAKDPEAGYVSSHYLLDLAEGYAINPQYAGPLIVKIATGLQAGDSILARVTPVLGGQPLYIEQLRLWARCHRAHGQMLAWAQRGAEAIAEYHAAIAAFEKAHLPIDVVDTEIWLATAEVYHHGSGWPQSVDQRLENVVAESQRLHYPFARLVSRYWQGVLRNAAGDLPGAEAALRDAAQIAESIITEWGATGEGRSQLLHKCHLLYELLVDVLIRENKPDAAMEMSEQARSQAQLASLDVGRIQTRSPQVSQALQTVNRSREKKRDLGDQLRAEESLPPEQRNQARITQLNGEIAHNQQEFYQALNQIKQVDPDYERLVAVRPTGFAKIQPHLPADTVLLQYFPSADKLYIFVATHENLKIKAVPVPRAKLEQDVHVVRNAIVRFSRQPSGEPIDANSKEALMRLHQSLIDPVADDIKDKSTVAIVPSGILYYLPFSALIGSNGEYLVARKAVVTLTALEILELMETHAPGVPNTLLALGNPDGTLPGAQQEVNSLADLFKKRQVFFQQQASKACLTHVQPGTSVVHLATHGVLNSSDVNNSYLIMAGDGAQGKLTAGEIYGLNLKQVSLVTLSACQTALGEAQPGAEIATLAQAFSVAGSRSMLASLWSVSDKQTCELMVAFYKTLLAGKSKAEALRQAQLSLLNQAGSTHPFYWAAFELVGDWR